MGTGWGVLPVTCHESVAWISDSQSLALKKPLAGLGQEPFNVALHVFQASAIGGAFTADQCFARRMPENIMLCLPLQDKTMLFNELE